MPDDFWDPFQHWNSVTNKEKSPNYKNTHQIGTYLLDWTTVWLLQLFWSSPWSIMFPVAQSITPQAVWTSKATKAPWRTGHGPCMTNCMNNRVLWTCKIPLKGRGGCNAKCRVPHTTVDYLLFHRLVVCVCMLAHLVDQLCLTLCDPMDCSPPGSSVHGVSRQYWSGLPFPIPMYMFGCVWLLLQCYI